MLTAGLLLIALLAVHFADHRIAEQALRRSEGSARTVFATIPLPVWVCDLRTLQILEVNRAAIEHYGYSRDEFLGMKISHVQTLEEREWLDKKIRELTKTRRFFGACKHRTSNGRILQVEVSAHTLLYEGSIAMLIVAQDVSARVHLEMELRQAQKLEAVGGLAAGIAHEINTPIQFVGDNTHFLQESFYDVAKLLAKYRELGRAARNGGVTAALTDDVAKAEATADLDFLLEEIPKALDQSLDGVTRVAKIVRAMKELAPQGRGEKTAIDLNKALQSTLVVASHEIKYVADVKTDFRDLPLVRCDGGDMNQVFLNLLINAAHAIKDRFESGEERGAIEVRTCCDGDQVEISISDTGCGIPANIHDKIFDPFFTTKAVGRGSGQGLAIARAIVVEKHGGSLTFDSEVGRGTTFHVRLPLRSE